ncbi:hypothetical protein RhiJN_22856 [Ceratobasidium sp. AG-Ba]|nr:hypothetical protein RhiJN_22856 [Ceratobasidium sp. AG-Ba]
MAESRVVEEFRKWAADNQIYIHPALAFVPTPSGHSVCAKSEILPDTKVLSCPFNVAITAPLCKFAIESLFPGIASTLAGWNERQIVCTYIIFHLVWSKIESGSLPPVLKHLPYVSTLPPPSKLLTPLYFSQSEFDLLEGSNLYPATIQRRQDWQAEWKGCAEAVTSVDEELGAAFTWDHYLASATYLSSRAFPSTLLSPTPTNTSPETSHQVLLPGIDSLNHKRATPVSWVSSTGEHDTLDLILHEPVPQGSECFNNYGPKPNSELILGYGFAIPSNPDDTIILSLASSNSTGGIAVEIGREGRGAEKLWDAVVEKVKDMYGEEEGEDWEIELEAAETVIDLTQKRLQRLPGTKLNVEGARKEVLEMVGHYLEGTRQRAVLGELIQWSQLKRNEARDKAAAQGIDVDLDEDDGN